MTEKKRHPKLDAMIAAKITAFLRDRGISIPRAARAEEADRRAGGNRYIFAHPEQLALLAKAECDANGWPHKPWLISAISGTPMTVAWR